LFFIFFFLRVVAALFYLLRVGLGLPTMDAFLRALNSPQVELNFLKLTSNSSIEWFFLGFDFGLLLRLILVSLTKRQAVLLCRFSEDFDVLFCKDLAEVQLRSAFYF
jgi:hypothetical protein